MESNAKTAASIYADQSSQPSLLRRIERFLDGRTWIVLVLSPVIVAVFTGSAIWWYLAHRSGLDSNIVLGATTIGATSVFSFGVIISLYLKTLFRRFNRLRSALNVVGAPLIIYGENRKVVQFNQSAYEYYKTRNTILKSGIPELQLLELAAEDCFESAEEKQQWIDHFVTLRQQHVESGIPLTIPLKKNEDPKTAQHLQVSLAKLKTGELVEMRTDVTALKLKEIALAVHEKELENSRDEAQASNRAKSEFLANMSHEIRTPMNGVVGMTELLLDSRLTDDQRLYASTVSTSAQSLLTLINDILDFSKVEAGKLELDSQAFDLRRMFDDIAAMLATRAHSKGVELVMNYAPELPSRFIADESRLRQIVTNLVGNAVKFTDSGYVAVHVTAVTDVNNGTAENLTLLVEVSDTGIGIPLDKQEHVFRMFEQVDGASNRRFEGSGLGLAISRRLLHLMDTDIGLKSELGVGSTFSFNIKLSVDKNQSFEQASVRNVNLLGLSVLVVDDLPLNTEILSRRIKLWGMRPLVAHSAQEALKIAKIHKCDLALIDFQMPVMDGHELCVAFKADPSLADIPIVLISSVDQSVQGARVRELGFAGTMVKPVRTEVLLEKVTNVLAGSSTGETPECHIVLDEPAELSSSNTDEQTRPAARILVVEDNLVNQMVITGMLENLGFTPDIADNGQEGVDAYSADPPDLVLMDISMPVLNGLKATHAIRDFESENNKPRCAIVALTANAMKGDRERCIASGMDDFLAKPVLMNDLSAMLERWLENMPDESPDMLPRAEGF
ncbi:MAG: response regulator [Granulosicoccus sp.]